MRSVAGLTFRPRAIVLGVAIAVTAVVAGGAQGRGQVVPPLVPDSLVGAMSFDDARVAVRLRNLVAFVESMQQAPLPAAVRAAGAAPADGAALFRTYCAACHGPTGLGDGPMAGQLRHLPPNLTTFATRNGGTFPSERLRQVIDGTGVASHGDRDMPVWGAVFKRLPVGGKDAQDRIDAVVRFLREIQERPAE